MIVPEFCLGSMSVMKVHELDLNGFAPTQLFPGLDPSVSTKHADWIDPRTYDLQTGHVFMSVHIWVAQFEGKVILIDTGAGNDKDRPTMKVLDHLHNPYLARHAAERNAVYFSGHFPFTSVGRITKTGENFAWEFVASARTSAHIRDGGKEVGGE